LDLTVFGCVFLAFAATGFARGLAFLEASGFVILFSFFAEAFLTAVLVTETFFTGGFTEGLLAFGRAVLTAGFFSATFFIGLTSCAFWAGLIFALPTAGLVFVAAMVSSSGQDINPCQVPENGPERV
jgi:hypothetical protein